jgi:hypothetical protein|tara:strand:- start:218 stop:490 length:273 start_codon:yes stop_codon:yes gene_type:complete
MNENNKQSTHADESSGAGMSAEHRKYCNHDDIHVVKGSTTQMIDGKKTTTDFLVCNDCHQVGEAFGKSVSELRMDFPSKEFHAESMEFGL